jgi:hypothetical protein
MVLGIEWLDVVKIVIDKPHNARLQASLKIL